MKKNFIVCLLIAFAVGNYALVGFGESNIFAINDNVLPVQLSSFSATIGTPGCVSIVWTTESESALLGFRLYRAESVYLANAISITPESIPATNTTSSHTYHLEDREVSNNSTYYYWLESVSVNNSEYFGPVSVTIQSETVPPLPDQSSMQAAYPNPFRFGAYANVNLAIKNGESGTLTVYNLQGKTVRSATLPAGVHQFRWDGRDNDNQPCGSGIYFIGLKTPSYSSTSKLVLVK